ncbi:MAG: metallophosphoesterase [Deltaproteobacteria bacterium]|nr:metallophosphoesterase [Deltaproteobacteria bacterium]
MARRRRRPTIIFAVLILFTLCEIDVVRTAVHLGELASNPSVGYALTHVFPVMALLLALGPFAHVPTMLQGIRLPGWVLGFLAPSYLFVLACAAYGFFGGIFSIGRLAMGMPEPTPMWQAMGLALPFALAVHGASAGQLWTRVERIEMALRGLGAGLEGLRVVQLSDLHAGGLVGERRLRRIAAKVTKLRPDLIVITGDIVNSSPSEAELAGEILGELEAPFGVWACLGNHDHFVSGDGVAKVLERHGIQVLRNRGEVIRRGDGALWLAGVDDTWTSSDDLDAALADKPAGIPTLLLAHDPNLWPQAVAKNVEWTLSGHTHGGQVGLVKLHPSLSLARIITPFVAGLYRQGLSALYVSRGTANTLPLRLGAPTEVSVFELKAS